MDKIKKTIIILIIIILIIIILLNILNKNNKNGNKTINKVNIENTDDVESEENTSDENLVIQPDENIKEVEYTSMAFNVQQYIQKYIDFANENNDEAIMEILDKNYIDKNNINNNNVNMLYEKKYNNSIYKANKIYQQEKTVDETVYFAYGKLLDKKTYEDKGEYNFIVIINIAQNLYSVIPKITKNTSEEYNLNLEKGKENYNECILQEYTEADIVKEYFSYYKNLAENNSKKAFELLDKDYKNVRFNNSLSEYEEYLKDINMSEVEADKYQVNYSENDVSKEYIIITTNGLYYIIKETTPMNISFKLDTYSVDDDDFKNKYDKASNEEKVALNADKWMQMLQNKDFKTAYGLLDSTFKSSNFSNIENFKQYIDSTYGTKFNYELESTQNYSNNMYIQNVKITGESQEKEMKIILKLLDNRQFTLSFQK